MKPVPPYAEDIPARIREGVREHARLLRLQAELLAEKRRLELESRATRDRTHHVEARENS